MPKITFVGAGSVVFTKNLVGDILQFPALRDAEICLMDIDPERLRVADLMVRRVAETLGAPARVTATADLTEACRGAKYVITTIQVGGYQPATVIDFEIPKKYGLRQTIADTLGVGGIFRALRTIPPLVRVARTLAEVGAPNPLLLNYSNPMAMNMWGIYRSTGVPCVGLCHSVQGTSRQLANYAGLPYEDITYRVAGINHMAFFLEFRYRGQDAYPILFDLLENPSFRSDAVRFEMMRRLGYFVTESSEHQSEYVPYFLHHGEEVIRRFDIPLDEYLRRCQTIIATWEKTRADLLAGRGLVKVGRSVEYGSTILNSCETGEPSVVYGNVRNDDLIANLPRGCCVEVPCLVDRMGLQPTRVGDLPPQLASLIRTNVNPQELAVEAALTGRMDHLYHAAMLDPHTSATLRLDQIWAMVDEMVEAHRREGYFPELRPARAGTGRDRASLARVHLTVESEAFPDYHLGSFDLALSAENRTGADFTGAVAWDFDRARFAVEPEGPVDLRLAAGESVRVPVRFTRRGPEPVAFTVHPTCLDPRVLARGFQVGPRAKIALDENRAAALAVRWSGETVAEGRLEATPEALRLRFRVNDSHPTVDEAEFWTASALEFFFADPRQPRSPVVQVIALPLREAPPKVFRRDRSPIEGAAAAVEFHPERYEMTLSLPWGALGLEAGSPFLLEAIVNVTALGDAHGKVRQTWQETRNPLSDISRFAWIG